VVFTGADIVGYDFADQLVKLDKQLSNFDVSNADCYAQEDRVEILQKIKGMYTGGLEEFNDAVRNELQKNVLKAVRHTPHTLLLYTTLMTGLVAAVGFMFYGISWFRGTNTATFVSFSIYGNVLVGNDAPRGGLLTLPR
jgi:hypothetical protein